MRKNTTFNVDVRDVLGIMEVSIEQGLSVKGLLAEQDLPVTLLDNPDATISMDDCWRIISAHQNVIHEETGQISQRPLKRGTTRFVFSNLSHCKTLVEGLELLANTYNIIHGGNYNFVKKRGNVLSYIVDDKDFHYRNKGNDFAIEFALIKIHCMLTCFTGCELELVKMCSKRVRIPHDNHHLNFFDCDIHFGHGHYELAYEIKQSQLPFREIEDIDLSVQLLANYLTIVRQRQNDVFENTLVVKVMNTIKRGVYNQDDVAASMGMSVATLRRKLKSQGLSFRSLLDKVNSEVAVNQLLDQIPADDVAEKLGYCDIRSFKRAFKRWHGQSPAAFLKQNSAPKH